MPAAAAAAAVPRDPGVPVAAAGPSALRVGVVVWLASELMFFGGLFAGYFTLRANATGPWPPDGAEIGFVRPLVFTLVLVSSSFTMHGAVRAAEHGQRANAIRWLAVTLTLGAVFVANQAVEYVQLPFSIRTDAYGSIFFLMTGFHGLHVIGGLVLMVVVAGVVAGSSRAPVGPIVDVTSYYWHFVDVVWIALFTTIYVIR